MLLLIDDHLYSSQNRRPGGRAVRFRIQIAFGKCGAIIYLSRSRKAYIFRKVLPE